MNKRFTAFAMIGGAAALALVGMMTLSAPKAADDAPLLLASAENEINPGTQLAYYSGDSAAESAQLTQTYEQKLVVGDGDTLMKMLVNAGVNSREAHKAITSMSEVFKPRRLRPGHEILLTMLPGQVPDTGDTLLSMKLVESVERDVLVSRSDDGFVSEAVDHPLEMEIAAGEGHIEVSLFLAGEEAGIPPSVLADLIQVYSFEVDFQRDIRTGDGFNVMYERFVDEDGNVVRTGNILRASMTLSGKESTLYRFETAKGTIDFFDPEGKSARRTLMRTPINGARLSSGYGNRRHPVLGYTKLHTGTDFAAPRGTPIYAAGNGTIEVAGRNGGYGLYVRIRHNGTYKTAYAHMSGIARGIRRGVKVRQGQVIGYVGTTGRSTGNHLHYEVIRNGKFINSRTMHLPSGKKLNGADLEAFMALRETSDIQYAMLSGGTFEFAASTETEAGCGKPEGAC